MSRRRASGKQTCTLLRKLKCLGTERAKRSLPMKASWTRKHPWPALLHAPLISLFYGLSHYLTIILYLLLDVLIDSSRVERSIPRHLTEGTRPHTPNIKPPPAFSKEFVGNEMAAAAAKIAVQTSTVIRAVPVKSSRTGAGVHLKLMVSPLVLLHFLLRRQACVLGLTFGHIFVMRGGKGSGSATGTRAGLRSRAGLILLLLLRRTVTRLCARARLMLLRRTGTGTGTGAGNHGGLIQLMSRDAGHGCTTRARARLPLLRWTGACFGANGGNVV